MGIDDLKRALQNSEKAQSWRNRIVKEEPLLQISEESRKSLISRREKFEQLSKRFSINESENQPPRLVRTPVVNRIVAQNRRQSHELCAETKASEKNEEKDVDIMRLLTKSTNLEEKVVIPANKNNAETEKPNILLVPSRIVAQPIVGRRLPKRLQEKRAAVESASSKGLISEVKCFDNLPLSERIPPTEPTELLRRNVEEKPSKIVQNEGNNSDDKQGIESDSAAKVLFKLPSDAYQTPIIGKKNCGVRLRSVDTNSPFPEVMLIQFHGNRPLDVRLIYSNLSSTGNKEKLELGSYLLITRNRLIVWNGSEATVFSKSKATQMAYEILSGKELTCSATRVEIANDDRSTMSEFCRITQMAANYNMQNDESESLEPINEENMSAESANSCNFSQFDKVYWVKAKDSIELLSSEKPPDSKLFDSFKLLVFDFVTELYVWIGQNSDRSLISCAMKHAENLKNIPLSVEQRRLFGDEMNDSNVQNVRPDWIIFRKQTQGIADCIFRFKFDQWMERMSELAQNTSREFLTPLSKITSTEKVFANKRPWSVPATFGSITASAMSNRISLLCSDNAFFGILKDEEKLINELAYELGTRPVTLRQPLQIEGAELHVSDENLYTENLIFLKLADEENLQLLEGILLEFNNASCYIIEWHYRIEREGIRKLNGDRISVHETGRQRIAYFYWLGAETSIKDRSRCALALRKYDKNRQEHIRIEAGHEPPMFLNILNGQMIVSGAGSNYFLIVGSSDNLFSAEEMSTASLEFRAQGAYLRIVQPDNKDDIATVECWYGAFCSPKIIEGASKLGRHLAYSRSLKFNSSLKLLDGNSLEEFTQTERAKSTRLLHPTLWNKTAPRLFRVFGNEGEELACERYDEEINFTFKQSDLRDCVFVDQGTRFWIWSEETVSTYELKVADKIWHTIKGNPRETKHTPVVIMKGVEPEEFKSLFPTWTDWENYDVNNRKKNQKIDEEYESRTEDKVQYLCELLHERTRYRTIDELRSRQLPKGVDTKHMERYLNDADFLLVFKCNKDEYEKLPRWKQIKLKKEAKLF